MNPQPGQPQQPGAQQNPFLAFLAKQQAQGAQSPNQNMPASAQAASGMSIPGGAPVGAAPAGAQEPDIDDAAMPGQNPGVSKNLLGALNQLHGAITIMTDPQEIRMVRSIIVLLTQLVQRDQEVQNTRTGQATGGQPGGQPAFNTGQPAGAPNPAQ